MTVTQIVSLMSPRFPASPLIPLSLHSLGAPILACAFAADAGRDRFGFNVSAAVDGLFSASRVSQPGRKLGVRRWQEGNRPEGIERPEDYLHNFQNSDPAGGAAPFRAGDAVWANFAASYKVLPTLNLGLNGYYFQQIQNDTVKGQTSPKSETTNFSLGPGLMYQPTSAHS